MVLIDENVKRFICIVNEKEQYLNRYKQYGDCPHDRFVDSPLDATEFYEYNDGDKIYDAEYYTGQMYVDYKSLRPVIITKSMTCSVHTSHPTISNRPPRGIAETLRFIYNQ